MIVIGDLVFVLVRSSLAAGRGTGERGRRFCFYLPYRNTTKEYVSSTGKSPGWISNVFIVLCDDQLVVLRFPGQHVAIYLVPT